MKSQDEILNDVTSHKYVNESGPILEFIRQLAAQGSLGDVSEFIQAYVDRVPVSKRFILSSLPAKVGSDLRKLLRISIKSPGNAANKGLKVSF